MGIEQIRQNLIDQGFDPDDFDIEITEEGYKVTPKWYWEHLQKAKEADKPIMEDVEVVAETTVYALMDIETLAEMVVYLLNKVEELEG